MKKPAKKKKKRGSRKKSQGTLQPKTASKPVHDSAREKKEVIERISRPVVKKEPEKKKEEKSFIFKYINIAGQFLRESRMELKKVKWPTRKELLASTVMVIFLVLVVAFYLGVVDFGLIKIIKGVVG